MLDTLPFSGTKPLANANAAHATTSWTPDATATSDEDDTGYDLDPNTDISSRAIAERFAPASAQRRRKPLRTSREEEQPAPAMVQKSKGGLFGGLRIARPSGYHAPPINLLKRPQASQSRPGLTQNVLRGTARLLEEVLADFSIKGEVRDIKPGPVVTLYEVEPARGTKSSRVVGLADDIARSMSVTSARAAVVPGRNVIGIELPNVRRETVYLREVLESDAFRSTDAARASTSSNSSRKAVPHWEVARSNRICCACSRWLRALAMSQPSVAAAAPSSSALACASSGRP